MEDGRELRIRHNGCPACKGPLYLDYKRRTGEAPRLMKCLRCHKEYFSDEKGRVK